MLTNNVAVFVIYLRNYIVYLDPALNFFHFLAYTLYFHRKYSDRTKIDFKFLAEISILGYFELKNAF